MARPKNGEALIQAIRADTAGARPVRSVRLLGMDDELKFQQESDGMHVTLPARVKTSYAYAYKISFAGTE